LIAGRDYHAVIVRELAIGEEATPIDATFTVTGPDGLALEPTKVDRRPAWRFAAPPTGPLTLTARWHMDARYVPGDVCAASQELTLPVQALRPVIVGRPRFDPDGPVMPDALELPFRAPELVDARPLSVRLWLEAGATAPPAPKGRPTRAATIVFDEATGRLERGRGLDSGWIAALGLNAEIASDGVRVSPHSQIPVGSAQRFGMTVELRQGGRRLGGMQAGAVCRRVQLRGRSTFRCEPTVLRVLGRPGRVSG
ncbi:MAG TPA: hypothetical protein VIL49_09995, partial [Capillimicrobium sp.]